MLDACTKHNSHTRLYFFHFHKIIEFSRNYPDLILDSFLLYPYNLSSKFKSKLRHRLKLNLDVYMDIYYSI